MHSIRRKMALGALSLVALAASACGSDQQISGASSSSTSPSETSVPDVSSTSTSTETTVTVPGTVAETVPPTAAPTAPPPPPPPPPPTSPPAPTVPPAPDSAFTPLPSGGLLQPVSGGWSLDPATFSCAVDPGIPGWSVQDCYLVDDTLVLVARRNDDGRFGVGILHRFAGEGPWDLNWFATEDFPGVWDEVTVHIGDYGNFGREAVFIGYRYAGTGKFLDIDIAQQMADGGYIIQSISGLEKGNAALPAAPVDGVLISAVFGSEPLCCPENFRLTNLRLIGGDWSVNGGVVVPTPSVPAYPTAF